MFIFYFMRVLCAGVPNLAVALSLAFFSRLFCRLSLYFLCVLLDAVAPAGRLLLRLPPLLLLLLAVVGLFVLLSLIVSCVLPH
jgi:hypothetical protein